MFELIASKIVDTAKNESQNPADNADTGLIVMITIIAIANKEDFDD